MSILVQLIVGEFEFIERHRLFHPMHSLGRRVVVNVHPRRCVRVTLAGHQPGGAAKHMEIVDYKDTNNETSAQTYGKSIDISCHRRAQSPS